MTCSLIVRNMRIGEQNLSNSAFQGTRNGAYTPNQSLPIYDFSMPITSEGHEVLLTIDKDDNPEIFTLEDDDYPERFALSPVDERYQRANNRTIPVAVSLGDKAPSKTPQTGKLKTANSSLAEQIEKTTLHTRRHGLAVDNMRVESSKGRNIRSPAPSPEERHAARSGLFVDPVPIPRI